MTLRQPTERHGGNAGIDEEVATMASKAITSTDAWLVQAERVQREQSLSPSSASDWSDGRLESTIALDGLAQDLGSVLRSVCQRPGRWILIVEDAARPHRFWQALAFEDGSLFAELVSNHYLEGDDRLTSEQEVELLRLGWESPQPPRHPNWFWAEPTTSPNVPHVTRLALASLREVFGLADGDKVFTKLFASPNRGSTPASPEYVDEDLDVLAELAVLERDLEETLSESTGSPPSSLDRVYSRPPVDGTDEEIDMWAGQLADAILRQLNGPDWTPPSTT